MTDATFDNARPEPAPLTPATPKELTGLIKDWRAGRATRNLGEAFHDAYVALVGALMLGATLIQVVLKAQKVVSQCTTEACLSARTALPWAAFATAIAAALAISRLFGPVLASAAEGFWLLDAPIQRAKLLQGRLVIVIVASGLGGAVIGSLIAALTGSGLSAIGITAAATGLCSAAAVAFAAAQQGAEHHKLTRLFTYVFGLAGFAALVLVISVAAGWTSVGLSWGDLGREIGLLLIVVGAGALVLGIIVARIRLGRIRRTRLLSGGALVSGLSGAFFGLDIGLARDIVVERRAMEIGHVKARRGKGLGLDALVWREFQKLLRFPQPLIAVVAVIVVPYAADALGMSTLTPVFGALALFGATIPLLGGLRVLTRTGGLARALPFNPGRIKVAAITVPAAIAGVWALATTAAYVGFGEGAVHRSIPAALLMSITVAIAGLLGAIRWTTAKGVDFSKPMVSTQSGAFPPGLFTNLFRGFDICLLITAPMLLGFSPMWSLIIAGIAALILLGSFNAEEMRAKQEEQQKLMAKQKEEAARARQKKR